MDQIPLEFTAHLVLEDYLELIDYLRKHKTLECYADEASDQLNKHIDTCYEVHE